jgi:hypothetical protein
MNQSNSKFHATLKHLISSYWWVVRQIRRPDSVRATITVIGAYHTVRVALLLHDLSLEVYFVSIYILCRKVQSSAISPGWRAFKYLALCSANYMVGYQVNRDDRLQDLVETFSGIRVPAPIIAAVIAGFLLAVESFAEAHQLTHTRRDLFTRGTVLEEEEETFRFFNPASQDVMIEVSSAASSLDLSSFETELCDANFNVIGTIKRRGRLASSEGRLARGHYILCVRNTNRPCWPIRIFARISIEVRADQGGGAQKPEPIDTRNLLGNAVVTMSAKADTLPPLLCPTNARAAHSPEDDVGDDNNADTAQSNSLVPLSSKPPRKIKDESGEGN